ncbi:MAG: class I SAM-dependent methyltransferase [Byssovorax sp.]
MSPLLYSSAELVDWYDLVDPPGDHADEAATFLAAFTRALGAAPATLLELGSGAGHAAVHLKRDVKCTLSDLSEPMLARSRALNPECEHILADMRELRLGREHDAVLVHDAIMYMLTEADLTAAVATAFLHTRPGGAAIFAPDCFLETLVESTETEGVHHATRALHYLCWDWDPDPTDTTFVSEYVFLLREGGQVRAIHDHHLQGVFPRATWRRILTDAGFAVEPLARPIGDDELDEVFLCRR